MGKVQKWGKYGGNFVPHTKCSKFKAVCALNNKAVSVFFLIFRGGPVWSSSRALRNLQNHFY